MKRFSLEIHVSLPISVNCSEKIIIKIFVSVQLEIAERRQFLQEMESLGQGEKYRHIIETEISRVTCFIPLVVYNFVGLNLSLYS